MPVLEYYLTLTLPLPLPLTPNQAESMPVLEYYEQMGMVSKIDGATQ